uniref:splicing factor Cactin n=1 Tax=Myxine glutinosa TaxID=7769 RepID=UPI00358FB89A
MVRSGSSTDSEYDSDSVSERYKRERRGSSERKKEEQRYVKSEKGERGRDERDTRQRPTISHSSSRERTKCLRKEEWTDDNIRSAREEVDKRSHKQTDDDDDDDDVKSARKEVDKRSHKRADDVSSAREEVDNRSHKQTDDDDVRSARKEVDKRSHKQADNVRNAREEMDKRSHKRTDDDYDVRSAREEVDERSHKRTDDDYDVRSAREEVDKRSRKRADNVRSATEELDKRSRKQRDDDDDVRSAREEVDKRSRKQRDDDDDVRSAREEVDKRSRKQRDDDDDDVRSARVEVDKRSRKQRDGREKRHVDDRTYVKSESSQRIPGEAKDMMEIDGETDGSSAGTKTRGRCRWKLPKNREDSSGSERGRESFRMEERRQYRSSSGERRLGKSIHKDGSESSSEGRSHQRKRQKENVDFENASRSMKKKNRKHRSSESFHSSTEEEEEHLSRQSCREKDYKKREVSSRSRRRSPSSSPVCETRRSKMANIEDSTSSNPKKAEEDCRDVLAQRFSESRSSSSDSSGVRSAKTSLSAAEKKRLKEEQKREREVVKALETPEEKRARRLAKREAKERRRRQRMGWSEEYMGYTNADNPFGDNNLLGTFFWHKALEQKGIAHLCVKEKKDRNKRIQAENRLELQKVKELRQEREREQSLREQELELLQREKEAEHFKQWEEQEDSFHLQQAKLRSKIRIKDGRAKPIDLLAKYISAEDDDLALEMHEPYSVLAGLALTDLEDLLEDIQVYIELEQEKNVDFWRDMTIITEDELTRLRKLQAELGLGPGDRREGINPSVSGDVQGVFKGKSYGQLQALNAQIENKILSGQALDIGYWESLLQQLRAYMARARLRERHQAVLRQKLFKLKQEQGVASAPLFPIIKTEEEEEITRSDTNKTLTEDTEVKGPAEPSVEDQSTTFGEETGDTNSGAAGTESVLTEQDVLEQSMEECEAGGYTPPRLDPTALPSDADIRDPDEDEARLDFVRSRLLATGRADESADEAFERQAREGMCADEARFSVEVPVSDRLYLWSDKYRPRKPRFFNRVHTGFEWNKYNQTHYDFDNPPPKIVQGYKFNIFYPDLIDKKSTPQYFLESCSDNRDFAILRFRAGPPYEDIAFKIVNREWEYSHRHGFRCQFANSIFQLWFHFKRFRYRR